MEMVRLSSMLVFIPPSYVDAEISFLIFYIVEHFHLLDNLKWSFLFLFLEREKRIGIKVKLNVLCHLISVSL